MKFRFIENYIWHLKRCAAMRRRPDGKFLLRQEKRIQKKMNDIFKKQQKWVLDNVKDFMEKHQKSQEQNTLSDNIDDLLNGMVGKEEMVESILFYTGVTMKKGGQKSVKELALKKFGISFDLDNPAAVKYLKEKRVLELSNYKGNIAMTTKLKIKEIVIEGVSNGKAYTEVAKEIMEQGKAGVFSRARAEMIAVREAGVGYEEGRKYPIDEFIGKNPDRQMEKSWSTVKDDRVTEECEENEDEGWIGYNETFSSGDETAPRSGNPRCRCTMLYQIE